MSRIPHQLTVPEFVAMKAEGRKITLLTAYDYPTARMLDSTGIEGILVGDSLSMVPRRDGGPSCPASAGDC